jgi:hypothetical protein
MTLHLDQHEDVLVSDTISQAELAVLILEAMYDTPRPCDDPATFLDAMPDALRDAALRAAASCIHYLAEQLGGRVVIENQAGHA